MAPARTWRAEVVRVLHLADDREDDVHRRLGSARGPGGEDEHHGDEDEPSGCRPVASHTFRFASEGPDPSSLFGNRQRKFRHTSATDVCGFPQYDRGGEEDG